MVTKPTQEKEVGFGDIGDKGGRGVGEMLKLADKRRGGLTVFANSPLM